MCVYIYNTVESRKVSALGLEILFRIISSSNYREANIKIYPIMDYYHLFLSNISFGRVKKSQGDVALCSQNM